MRLIRSIATISGFTLLSRVFGFIRDTLMAAFLGAGPVSDAFLIAFKFPNFFRRLFAEGALNAAFVPMFTRLYTSAGLNPATRLAEEIFAFLSLLLIIFVLIIEFTMNKAIYLMAPGFQSTPERFQMTLDFSRITFPYILFISLAAFLGSILNSFHRFSAAAAAPVLLNIFMITAILIAAQKGSLSVGYSLSWCVLLAGIAQLIWMYHQLYQNGIVLSLRVPRMTPSVKKLLKIMGPGIFGIGITQINLFIDSMMASFLKVGSVSYLFYADRLNQLPLSLIGIAVSTALLPLLSQYFQRQEIKEAHETLNRTLEFTNILTIPAAFAFIILARPIFSVLFERYEFGSLQVLETAKTLAAFSVGLPAYIMTKVLSTSFFAQHDTKTPVKAAMISMSVNIIVNLCLIIPFHHVGLAFGTALAAWVNALYLLIKLKKNSHFQIDERLWNRSSRILFSALGMMLVLGGSASWLGPILLIPSLTQVIVLIFLIILGIITYGLLGTLTRAFNLKEIYQTLKSM